MPCASERQIEPHPRQALDEKRAVSAHGNRRVATFYDRVASLYPLIDVICGPGRRRLILQVNREPAGRLLEIGVGPGHHLRLYRHHAIVAIDCSHRMVAQCRRSSPGSMVLPMDGESLDFPEASFDYAVLCHVLSVTANPSQMLAEIHRVLRPAGRLFVLNHVTPEGAWRFIDTLLAPFARQLCFRSRFRVTDLSGIERFRSMRHLGSGLFGLMKAYAFEK